MTNHIRITLPVLLATFALGSGAGMAQASTSTPTPPATTPPPVTETTPTPGPATLGTPQPGDPAAGPGEECFWIVFDVYTDKWGDDTDDWPEHVQGEFEDGVNTLCGDLIGNED